MKPTAYLEVYRRKTRRLFGRPQWGWRLVVPTVGEMNIVATDGGQGYESQAECVEMGTKVTQGGYDVEVQIQGGSL